MESPTPLMTAATPLSVSKRRLVPEIMDDPQLDPALHETALAGLGRINRLSRSAQMLWPSLVSAAKQKTDGPLRVIDLACGGGDVLIQLAQKASQAIHAIEFVGADISPVALDFARRGATQAKVRADWIELDVFRQPLPPGFDVAMNSLFMHHLTADQAVSVLQKMKAASDTVLINDLRRGAVAHLFTVAGTRLLSRSPVVHVDGPRSVRAAWTPTELAALAEQAGLHHPVIRRKFPWRMTMAWRRKGAHGEGATS